MTRISSTLVLAAALAFMSSSLLNVSAATLPAHNVAERDIQVQSTPGQALAPGLATRDAQEQKSADATNSWDCKWWYGRWVCTWKDDWSRNSHDAHNKRDDIGTLDEGHEISELVERDDWRGGHGGHDRDHGHHRGHRGHGGHDRDHGGHRGHGDHDRDHRDHRGRSDLMNGHDVKELEARDNGWGGWGGWGGGGGRGGGGGGRGGGGGGRGGRGRFVEAEAKQE